MLHDLTTPTVPSTLPDAQTWASTLGVGLADPSLPALAIALLDEHHWRPLGAGWPHHGQAVQVVLLDQRDGSRSVHSAGYNDPGAGDLDLMWPWVGDNGDAESSLSPADVQRYNRSVLEDRAHRPSFSMGGGDWSATFEAPLFGRRGMDYCESSITPWCFITHWRPRPAVPEHLSVPPHLKALVTIMPVA